MNRRADHAALPRQSAARAASPGEGSAVRRVATRMARLLRRLHDQLTSRNARMPGESACRLCGVCHHLCGLIIAPRRPGGSPKE